MISILYVDDENTLLMVTKTYLERTTDLTVTTCLSAKDALALLSTTPFDAIVSDYQMPVMDGLLFLKHLRGAGNTIPFILFTGKGREEVAIEALNSGADFYLQKGGEPKSQFAELTNKIRQAVQRRHAERALAASEEKFRELVENINDILYTLDGNGIVSYVSPMISQFGYSADELVGRSIMNLVVPDDGPAVQDWVLQIREGSLQPCEFRITDGSGKIRFVRASSRPVIVDGKPAGVRGVLTDITEQKSAGLRVLASEQRYRNVFEAAGDAMLVIDKDTGKILDANSAAQYLFGHTIPELKCMKHEDLLMQKPVPPDQERTMISGIPLTYYRTGEGTVFPADVLITHYPQKRRTISIHSIRNVSSQKDTEERSVAAQRLYAVLSQINSSIVRVRDLETLVADICRISVDYGHFQMVWVGLFDKDSQVLRPVAHAGNGGGDLALIETAIRDDESGRGPANTALREGHFDVCNDIANDPRMAPFRSGALDRGYHSAAAFPFRLHDEIVGVYVLYASRRDFFTGTEIALLEEIADDISFALDMLDERARRTHAENALAGSEERAHFLAEVIELSSQPFGVAYPGGRFGIVNPALCDLLGYTEQELRSKSWMEVTPPESHEREAEALAELARSGIPQRYEKEYIRKDGSRVPVEALVHRVTDEGGNLRYYYGFITDISERRRIYRLLSAERDRAQLYLDAAGVMLAALSPEGTITRINRKGCEILGYSEEELTGRNWLETCLPDRIRDEVSGVFHQILSGDIEPVAYHENTVLTKNGQERILAFHNTLIREDGQNGIFFSGEDITQRRQAEHDLQQSEERFRNLIQNSSEMIRIIGKDGLITYSSPSTLRITGFDPADVVGKSPFDFIHPDDKGEVAAALGEVINRTNPGIPTEYRIRHADGSYLYVETVATNLIGVPGIDGILTTARPIAERKRAEEALRESEAQYRAIFGMSEDAIIIIGPDHVVDCNPRAEQLFGCSRAVLLGSDLVAFYPDLQSCGRPSVAMGREYLDAVRGGALQTFDWTYRTKDGRQFPAQVTLIPVQAGGERRIIAIIHDRSIRSHEEQQSRHLAKILELNPNPVIEVHPDGRIIYANPATCTLLRRLGMPADPAAFFPADFPDLAVSLREGRVTDLYREVQVGTAWFRVQFLYDRDERIIRIHAHDITREVDERTALVQATRNLNRLSGITRHDIKNKLTGVMGYLELARGSVRDPELAEYIHRAEISATAVREQIEFTKEYENLGTSVPIWQEFSAVLTAARAGHERSSVPVVEETGGLVLYADPLLPRAIHCILENAVIHGKQLTQIRIHGSVSPSAYILVIEDDGIGIPADQKEKIFNRKVSRETGTIGLFVCREILSITGITVEETGIFGKGARFELSVPIGKFQLKPPES